MNRRTLIAIAAIAAFTVAGAAQAHNTLRLYLAERGLSIPGNVNSPSLAPLLENPVVPMNDGSTKRLYVWAQLHNESPTIVWNGVGFNVKATGAARITNAVMYNANANVLSDFAQRWEGVMAPMSDTSGNGSRWSGANGIAGLLSAGLPAPPIGTDSHYQHSVQSYLIGHIDAVGAGDVFLEIGDMGIVEFNSPAFPGDEIELGFDDDADHIRGGHFGTASTLPDAILQCQGDLNGDMLVDTADLGILLSMFNTTGAVADINGDGAVDTADLGILLAQFNTNCAP